LGAVAVAALVAFAVHREPLHLWGEKLVKEILPKAKELACNDLDSQSGFNTFVSQWEKYLTIRGLSDGKYPTFPEKYGIVERDEFYKSFEGGFVGYDCVIIAYDALLCAGNSWEELIKRYFK
jgi:ADP-ribosylarginine hydrolase